MQQRNGKQIGFLGVVIGSEGIKMKEEKIKGVLDWLTPKGVKDIQKFLGLANYFGSLLKILCLQPDHYMTW